YRDSASSNRAISPTGILEFQSLHCTSTANPQEMNPVESKPPPYMPYSLSLKIRATRKDVHPKPLDSATGWPRSASSSLVDYPQTKQRNFRHK
ncbi:2933_t:CDS:2, partial [Entrophospora sp. SA101]